MVSSKPKIPDRLLQKNRPPDNDFSPEEKLYRRISLNNIENNKILPSAIRFPDFSVNRSKYSEPEDVLIPDWQKWGIVSFKVKEVPCGPIKTDSSHAYTFKVEHSPEPENYSHSEVRTYKDDIQIKDKEPSKGVKTQFRLALWKNIILIKQPKV